MIDISADLRLTRLWFLSAL